MATPVVPSQFAVGKNRIIHKPTTATFSLETGHTTFKSINWGRADEQLSSDLDYRKDDIIRVAQQLLSKQAAKVRARRKSDPLAGLVARQTLGGISFTSPHQAHAFCPAADPKPGSVAPASAGRLLSRTARRTRE